MFSSENSNNNTSADWSMYHCCYYALASCLVFLTTVGYWFSTSTFDKWKRLNVPYLRPVPLFGNFAGIALGIVHPVEFYDEAYHELAGHRYGGLFQMRTPYLMIRDPELINALMIKDFSHFPNRGIYSDFAANPLSNSLFFMETPQWKVIRNKLSPAFSSGKIKLMYDQIRGCGGELMKDVRAKITADGTVEVRDIMAKFATEVVGIWAFGIKLNAVNDTDCAFRKYGKAIFTPSLRVLIRELCLLISPALLKVVKLKDFPSEAVAFFYSAFQETIACREKSNVVRKDFVHVLLEARKDLVLNDNLPPHEKFTESQIVANAFTIFAAGFETISTTLSFCLYELALNKNIQDRLREEIILKLSKYNGTVDNELLMDLNYLDMVLAESLRMYSPFFALFRKASQDYQLPDGSLTIKKGQQIIIPIHSLHYDPQYFKDPIVFNPERFSPDEKANIINGTYLPFGAGPRICIGKRFAELEMKLALVEILSKFEVTPCEKTEIPIKFSKKTLLVQPKNGVWLTFKKIVE